MSTTTAVTTSSPLGRIARGVPILGRVIRDVERDVDTVYYLITIFVTAVVLAVQTWGLPALVLTAVAAVPLMFVLLVILARP